MAQRMREKIASTTSFLSRAALTLLVCSVASPSSADDVPAAVETVLRSAPIYGANGLAIDKDDHLVIAAINPKAVLVMDTDTGKILEKHTHPLITGPDDVSIAKDGSIYYTDIFSGNIGRIAPTGEVSLVANLGPWVNSIRLSPDETKLYVGHCIGDDRLTEIDLQTGEIRIVAENVGWPNSMSFGPDGRLYSPLNMRGEVVRWDLGTGEREVVFRVPTPPSSIKFDSKGRMLVTEFITGRLTRYDPNRSEKTIIAENLALGLDNVAIDSTGRMFIASNHSGDVMEVYEDGRTRELSPPGLLVPSSVAVMSSPAGEQLVVADFWNVRFFDTGSFQQTRVLHSGFYPWGRDVKEAGEYMNVVLPVTARPSGDRLVISSWQSNAINVYDLKQNRVTRTIDGNYPIDAIEFGDDLIVSELLTHSVVAISPDGERRTLAPALGFLEGSDSEGESSWMPDWLKGAIVKVVAAVSDGMVYPSGLAAEGKDLWVADWFRGEILQVIGDGEVLNEPKVVAGGLEQPEGLAVGKDGSLLVVESKIGRLVKVDPASGKKTVLAEDLETGRKSGHRAPPSYVFSGVAVGSDGSIYLSCDEGKKVVRVKE